MLKPRAKTVNLLPALGLLVALSGCTPSDVCNHLLVDQWNKASLRDDFITQESEFRRPTEDEAKELRKTIRRCKIAGTHFNLGTDLLEGDDELIISTILLAVELNDPVVLEELVSEGHSADGLPNDYGTTTLAFATYRQAENSFDWAMKKSIDPNLADAGGGTPLMIAAGYAQDRLNSIERLLEAGAEIDAVDSTGWSALAVAIRSGRMDNAKLLVDSGAEFPAARHFLLESASTVPSEEAAVEIRSLVSEFERSLQEFPSE